MRTVIAIVLAFGVIACGGSPSAANRSGVAGTVTEGPTCPVEMAGSPCPPRPWVGTVRAIDRSGDVVETQTDALGDYSLTLDPGTYDVVPVTGGGPPFGKPASVVVTTGVVQHLDLSVDTGIR